MWKTWKNTVGMGLKNLYSFRVLIGLYWVLINYPQKTLVSLFKNALFKRGYLLSTQITPLIVVIRFIK